MDNKGKNSEKITKWLLIGIGVLFLTVMLILPLVTVITEDFEKELGKLTKEETADRILDQILAQRGEV